MIFILLAAYIGANYFYEYVAFARRHKDKLSKILIFGNGIPSHDTLERVIAYIHSSELEDIIYGILIPFLDLRDARLAVDGKYIRATRDVAGETTNAINLVTLFDTESRVAFFTRKTNVDTGKGGELGAMAKLIARFSKLRKKKNIVVTIDAIGANQHIVNLLAKHSLGFIIGIKAKARDRHGLFSFIKDDFDVRSEIASKTIKNQNQHGRIEERTYSIITDTSYVKSGYGCLWQGVKGFGKVHSKVTIIKTGVVTKNIDISCYQICV